MIGESESDILVFFTTDAFARPVQWTANSATVTIVGIFDEQMDVKEFDGQHVDMVCSQPVLRVPYFQVKNMKRGDQLAFTDPSGTVRTFTASRMPEREADGLTAIIYLRET